MLWEASRKGLFDIVQTLLQSGVNIQQDTSGYNPLVGVKTGEIAELLDLAIRAGDVECIEMLLQKGVDVNKIHVTPGRNTAVEFENISLTKMLFNLCAEVNMVDSSKSTALMTAVQCIESSSYGSQGSRFNTDVIKLLLKSGADVNIINAQGMTALHIACQRTDRYVVSLLVNAGADVNICDESGNTALMIALLRNNVDIASLLIDRGCDFNAVNNNNENALTIAIGKGYVVIIRSLIAKGANMNVENEETPLL